MSHPKPGTCREDKDVSFSNSIVVNLARKEDGIRMSFAQYKLYAYIGSAGLVLPYLSIDSLNWLCPTYWFVKLTYLGMGQNLTFVQHFCYDSDYVVQCQVGILTFLMATTPWENVDNLKHNPSHKCFRDGLVN